MKTNSTGFIVVLFASVLLGSCEPRRSTDGDGSTTSATSPSAAQPTNESEGMDLVHRGLELVKSGKDLVSRGQLAGNPTTVNQGMSVIDQGLAVVSTGQALMEKDRAAMEGEHPDGEHTAGEHPTDEMSAIHQGMRMMNQGKDMAGKGVGAVGQDSALGPGTMNKRMMDMGMAMMEKGMAMTEQCCGGKTKRAPMNSDSSRPAPAPAAPAMGDAKPMPQDVPMKDDM